MAKTGDGGGKPLPSELPIPERRAQALNAAFRLLTVRERSASELRERLRAKGYDPETVVATLDRLQELGLQDDRRFAETFAASRVRSRGMAGRVVQGELRKKGIDSELAAQASTRSPEEEAETARQLAGSRAARLRSYPPEVRTRRLMAFLARKGYPYEVCRQAVESALADPGA